MTEVVSRPIYDCQTPVTAAQYRTVPNMDPNVQGLHYPKRDAFPATGPFQAEYHSAGEPLSNKRRHDAVEDISNKRKNVQQGDVSSFHLKNSASKLTSNLPENQMPLRIQIPG